MATSEALCKAKKKIDHSSSGKLSGNYDNWGGSDTDREPANGPGPDVLIKLLDDSSLPSLQHDPSLPDKFLSSSTEMADSSTESETGSNVETAQSTPSSARKTTSDLAEYASLGTDNKWEMSKARRHADATSSGGATHGDESLTSKGSRNKKGVVQGKNSGFHSESNSVEQHATISSHTARPGTDADPPEEHMDLDFPNDPVTEEHESIKNDRDHSKDEEIHAVSPSYSMRQHAMGVAFESQQR